MNYALPVFAHASRGRSRLRGEAGFVAPKITTPPGRETRTWAPGVTPRPPGGDVISGAEDTVSACRPET